jgi:hypothetical protein
MPFSSSVFFIFHRSSILTPYHRVMGSPDSCNDVHGPLAKIVNEDLRWRVDEGQGMLIDNALDDLKGLVRILSFKIRLE